MKETDLLSTEGLVRAGVVDILWNRGWVRATPEALRRAQHSTPGDDLVALPERAVIACFATHFPQALDQIDRDRGWFGRYVFVVRDGDSSLRDGGGPACNFNSRWPGCVHHLFGSSLIEQTPRATAVPMAFHAFFDFSSLETALQLPRERDRSVLVSYSLDLGGVTGRPGHERVTAIERFRDQSWATVNESLLAWRLGDPNVNPWPWSEYARRLRRHDYLIVPAGYGAERIAQWEAMVLGTIPICIRRPELLHFSDMPIAFVDSWQDVTPEWCEANLETIKRPMEKLKLSYWVERIREKAREL